MKYFSRLFSHWSTYAGTIAGIVAFATPSIDAYINAHSHTALAILLGAALAAYHAMPPKGQDAPPAPLKAIAIAMLLLGLAAPVHAQTAPAPLTNIYAAGVSFNNSGSPAVAGTGLYARLVVDGTGTYAFTAVDALPNSLKPFTVTTNFSAGIAQRVFTIGKVGIFVPTSAGVSFQGSNTGWAWSTGALASIKIGNKGWHLFPTVRVAKSSVSNGSGYQPIVGLLVGWGN